uniref:Uncharacterized protein n=1 Tax=Arundo donax TaxID=35708 RepID=A0A0A9DT29_ARUDO
MIVTRTILHLNFTNSIWSTFDLMYFICKWNTKCLYFWIAIYFYQLLSFLISGSVLNSSDNLALAKLHGQNILQRHQLTKVSQ